ncbi:MAG: fibronectin type III domain-containing protein, partial [Prevotellaceae bacterium]|nr:fibronectin type III domain-containing protein [Prevotellaceae bacterium]
MKKLNFFSKFIAVTAIITTCGAGSIKAQTAGEYTGVGVFEKISSANVITAGYYVIVATNADKNYAMTKFYTDYNGTLINSLISGDNVNNPVPAIVWYISGKSSATIRNVEALNGSANHYVNYTGTTTGVDMQTNIVGTGVNVYWSFSDASGLIQIQTTHSSNRNLQYSPSSNYFRAYSNSYTNVSLYKLLPATCPKVSILSIPVNTVTSSGATISWTAGGSETEWEVQYKKTSESEWESVTSNPTTASAMLTDLDENTTYDVQVRAVCSESDKSDWRTGTSAFKTECTSKGIPYTEDFNLANYAIPDCWKMLNIYTSSGYDYPSVSTTYHFGDSGGSLVFSGFHTTNELAISPALTPEINTLEVTFKLKANYDNTYSSMTAGTFSVGYLTDLTNASTFVSIKDIAATSTEWGEQTVALDNVPEGIHNIVFKQTNANTWGKFYLDDINIHSLPPCFFVPKNAAIGAVTVNSAVIYWTAPSPAPTGYNVYISTENTAPTAETSPTDYTVDIAYTYTDGIAYETYYAWVRANCGDAQSEWVSAGDFWLNTIPEITPAQNYTANFNSNDGWLFISGSSENKWVIDNTTGGDYEVVGGLYVTADNGATNSYNTTIQIPVFAYKTVEFSEEGKLDISFDWRSFGTSYYTDFFRIYLVPENVTFSTTTTVYYYSNPSASWISLDGVGGTTYSLRNSAATTEFTTSTFNANVPSAGKYNIVVAWKNGGTVTLPPAAIDNLSISYHPKYTVTYNAGSGTCEEASATEAIAGGGITLPTATPTCAEWVFAGWSESPINAAINTKPTLLLAGAAYKPTEDKILYAVYKLWNNEYEYNLVTDVSQLENGTYLIGGLFSGVYYFFSGYSSSNGNGNGSTTSSGSNSTYFASLPSGAMEFTFTSTGTANRYYIKYGDNYLGSKKSGAGGLTLQSDIFTSYWTISGSPYLLSYYNSVTTDGGVTGTYTLYFYSSTIIRAYGTHSYTDISLFKKGEAATYHSVPCPMLELIKDDELNIEYLNIGTIDLRSTILTGTGTFDISGSNLDGEKTVLITVLNASFESSPRRAPAQTASPNYFKVRADEETDFAYSVAFPASDLSGSSKTITVKYEPEYEGEHSATINVSYADGEIEKEIIISGSATNIVTGLETAVIVRTIYARGQEIFV